MLYRLLLYLTILFLIYALLKRLLGLALSRAATNRHVRVKVSEIGLLVSKGIHIHLAKGPVEHIWIAEVSLGRTKSATKLVKGVAKAWSTYKPRLPLTVRGVRIELREGEDLPAWALRAPKKEIRPPPKTAKAAAAVTELEDKGKSVSRGLMIALAARLAFVALPVLPVRVKNVSLAHKSTGVLAEVARVELLFVSSQLASTLRMDLHILPVVASLLTELPGGAASGGAPASRPESAPAAEAPEAASRMPVLEVTDLSASATVQLIGQNTLRCKAVALQLGDIVVMASQALLAAASKLRAVPKKAKPKRAPKQSRPPSGSPLNGLPSDADSLAALLPDVVEVGLKQFTCHLVGGGPSEHALEAFAEATALQIKGRKPIPKKPSRRSRPQADVALLQQPLYIVDGATGAMQCGIGVVGQLPAASVACKGVELHIRVSKSAGDGLEASRSSSGLDRTQSSGSNLDGSEPLPAPLALTLQADADIRSLVTSCCVQTIWPVPAALWEVARALQPTRDGASDGFRRTPSGAHLEAGDDEVAAAAAADVPAATVAAAAVMQRQPSSRPSPLTIPDEQATAGDSTGPPSMAASPADAAEEQAQRERSESGGLASASSPSPGSAAEAARAAWAAAARGVGPVVAERVGRRPAGPARSSSIGEPKRTLGLKLSPRTSMGSSANRLLGSRRSMDRVGALGEEGDDEDSGGGQPVVFLLEWEASVHVDADSRLQLLSSDSAILVACGFDELGISGKSVTAVRLGGGVDKKRRPLQEAAGMQRRASAALLEEDEQPVEAGRPGLLTAEFSVQNICLSIKPAASKDGDAEEGRRTAGMLRLLSSRSFYAGVQPTESELMPSADHSGPLLLEVEVRTSEFAVAADAALLRSIAEVAASLAPPPGWKLPKAASQPRARNGRRGNTPKPAKPEKGAAKITIVTAVVAFEDISLAYAARVEVPAKFRKHGACGASRCELRFGIGRLAAAARPAAKRADMEIADVMLTYTENDDAGSSRSAVLLVIQEVLSTAQLLSEGAQPASQDTQKQGTKLGAPNTDQDTRKAPVRSPSDAAAALGTSTAGRSQQQQQSGPSTEAKPAEGAQEAGAKLAGSRARGSAAKALKVGVELEGLYASFEAEAVFAACHIAADVKAVRDLLISPIDTEQQPLMSPTEQSEPSTPAGPAPSPAAKWKATVAAATGKSAAASKAATPHASPRAPPKRIPRAPKLALHLVARLADLRAEMWLSDDVCWGVHLGAVTAAYAPRCAVVERVMLTLNDTPLITLAAAVAAVQLPGVLEPAAPEADPWAAFAAAEGESVADLGRLLTGGSLVAASPLAEAAADEHAALEVASHASQVTDLTMDDMTERTLSRQNTSMSARWQEIAEMGSGSEIGDATPLKRPPEEAAFTPRPLPQRPFGLGLERLPAAYRRAGLAGWAEDCASSGAQASAGESAKQRTPGRAEQVPGPPVAIVEAWLSDAAVMLPFARDPGTAERFTELWAKAFKEALAPHLEAMRSPMSAKPAKKEGQGGGEQALVEARVYLTGALFKMDHHPMEAWLAVHGPLLRRAAAQSSLWSRVVSAAASDVASRGVQEGSPSELISQQAAQSYRSLAQEVQTEEVRSTDAGALMHVAATTAEALIVVCGPGAASQRAALSHIIAVDPPSAHVQLKEVQLLHVDAALGPVTVIFSGAREPIAAAGATAVFGRVAVARQVTAPPALYTRQLPVGRVRAVEISVAIKGSRAMVKVYTDLQASVADVQSWYSVGLEPIIGLLSQAGKRLSPSDPDKTRLPSASLPFWDLMRFVWRGQLGLTARRFEFAMGKTPRPDISASSERLQVCAEYARVRLAFGGVLEAALSGVTSTAYRAAGLDEAAGALHALPLVDFPAGYVRAALEWELARGRNPDDHHLHPASPLGGDAKQRPIDMVSEYKCTAINVDMQATVGQRSAVDELIAASNMNEGAREEDAWGAAVAAVETKGPEGGSGAQGDEAEDASEIGAAETDGDTVMAYFGDHQVAFFKSLIELTKSPPTWLRMVNKRGTFFLPLDPRRPPSVSLPKLLSKFAMSVTAAPLSVVHYTVDLDNASCGLTLSCERACYAGRVLMNRPTPGTIKPGMSAIARKREANKTTTTTLLTDVAAEGVKFHWGTASDWRAPDTGAGGHDEQDKLLTLMDAGATLASAAGAAGRPSEDGASSAAGGLRGGPSGLRRLAAAAAHPERFILSIAACKVHEERPDPRRATATLDQQRPLKVTAQDCRVVVDVEARNAITAMVLHLVSAFKMPAKPRRPLDPPGRGGVSVADLPAKLRPAANGGGFARRRAAMQSLAPSPSLEAGGNLLRTLLQQQKVPGAPGGQISSVAESANEGEDEDANAPADLASIAGSVGRRTTQDSTGSQAGEEDNVEGEMAERATRLSESGGSRDIEDGGEEASDEAMRAMLGAQEYHEEIRERSRREEAAELSKGLVKWEVEVSLLQINLCSERAAGSFLLAAQKAQLGGRVLTMSSRNVLSVEMQEVQGHIAQADIDPGAATPWLRVRDGELCTTPGAGMTMKRVFNPFDWQLRHYRTAVSVAAASGGRSSQSLMDRSKSHISGSTSGAAAGSGGDEVRLRVPEISVAMDAKEFQILQDVGSHLAGEQMPAVEGIGTDAALLYEAESEEVVIARDTFASVRQYVISLQEEALVVATKLSSGMQRSRSFRIRSPLRASSSISRMSWHSAGSGEGPQWLDGIDQALRDYLEDLRSGAADERQAQALALRWSGEQIEGARQALAAARSALQELKAIERKRQQKLERASRLALEFDGVSWALCHGRTPFIEMALSGISLVNLRNRDQSGNSKLVIQSATVRDATGSLAAAAGTDAGAVLTLWNPDESWSRDALLRVNAVLGPATRTHTIYEHIELVVHPLGVHLNEAVASAFWEYFFPKREEKEEGAAGTKRQQMWVRSVDAKLKSRKSGSQGALAAPADLAADLAPPDLAAVRVGRPDGGTKSAVHTPHVPVSSGAGRPFSASEVHRRGPHWDGSSAADMLKQSTKAMALRRMSERPGAEAAAAEEGDEEALLAAAAERKAAAAAKHAAAVEERKVLFVHVRLNRVHCRVTYQGYPVNIKDLKVLLDKRVYRDLEGQWRDLFNRLKWDTVKSALKSVAGLQGRKFKELMPSKEAENSEGAARAGTAQLKSWISGLGKKSKDAETLKAKQREREQQRKERLLLGKTPSAAALLRGTSSNALAPAAAAGSADDMSAARGDNFLAAHFQPQRSTSATSGRSPAMLSPRSEAERGGRPPTGMRALGSASSAELSSHLISPRDLSASPLPLAASLTSMGSSMRSSPSSEQDNSSMEPPASPFQQQQRSSIGPERLQALLGPISSDGPPVPQSGFSAALVTPRSESTLSSGSGANGSRDLSDLDLSPYRFTPPLPSQSSLKGKTARKSSDMGSTPKRSVRFGDEPTSDDRRASESAEAVEETLLPSSSEGTQEFGNAQELKVGSKTLGNMLSSGRFAVISVEDVRNSLRGRISAPATFEEAGSAALPGRPADQPPPRAAPEAFPSSRTWPPNAGRSPDPAQAQPGDPPCAPGSPLPSEPAPPSQPAGPAESAGAPEAAASAPAETERPSAFAKLSGGAIAPTTPEQETHNGPYPQIETNVTRSGRLAADDQLEIDKNCSTELIIAQMKRDAVASRQRARPPGVMGLQLSAANANGRDTESDRVPIASAVIAPSNVKPLPSPFSLEGGSQPLTQDSPQTAQSDMEGNADEEQGPDGKLRSTMDDSVNAEENSDAPLPLGDISPHPQIDMSIPRSHDRSTSGGWAPGMSAAHLLIAAAGGLPEVNEASSPAALQSRPSYPSGGQGLDYYQGRGSSADAPATLWASPVEDQRRLLSMQQRIAASRGADGSLNSTAVKGPQVQGDSEDEGEGGLRLEDLLSGGTEVDLSEDEDDAASSGGGSEAAKARQSWATGRSSMEGVSMAHFKASASKTSKQASDLFNKAGSMLKKDLGKAGSMLKKDIGKASNVLGRFNWRGE